MRSRSRYEQTITNCYRWARQAIEAKDDVRDLDAFDLMDQIYDELRSIMETIHGNMHAYDQGLIDNDDE